MTTCKVIAVKSLPHEILVEICIYHLTPTEMQLWADDLRDDSTLSKKFRIVLAEYWARICHLASTHPHRDEFMMCCTWRPRPKYDILAASFMSIQYVKSGYSRRSRHDILWNLISCGRGESSLFLYLCCDRTSMEIITYVFSMSSWDFTSYTIHDLVAFINICESEVRARTHIVAVICAIIMRSEGSNDNMFYATMSDFPEPGSHVIFGQIDRDVIARVDNLSDSLEAVLIALKQRDFVQTYEYVYNYINRFEEKILPKTLHASNEFYSDEVWDTTTIVNRTISDALPSLPDMLFDFGRDTFIVSLESQSHQFPEVCVSAVTSAIHAPSLKSEELTKITLKYLQDNKKTFNFPFRLYNDSAFLCTQPTRQYRLFEIFQACKLISQHVNIHIKNPCENFVQNDHDALLWVKSSLSKMSDCCPDFYRFGNDSRYIKGRSPAPISHYTAYDETILIALFNKNTIIEYEEAVEDFQCMIFLLEKQQHLMRLLRDRIKDSRRSIADLVADFLHVMP